MSSSNPSSEGNDVPTKGQSTRAARGPNKRPTDRYTITEIDPKDGTPTKPKKAANAFRNMCGIVARERVPITLSSWRLLTIETRNALLTEILSSFHIPEESAPLVRRYALLAAGKAWKTFKHTLFNDYVKKDMVPYSKYGFIDEGTWRCFVEMKTTDEFVRQSEANKALQARNTHPHRLGTAGYAGKRAQWEREDEDGISPFASITDERARDWLRARSAATSSATVSFVNPADEEVCQRLVALSTQSGDGSFLPDREKDALSMALGNKEHPGRTRGKGVFVPWKTGFPNDSHKYRNKKRTKAERESKLIENLEERLRGELREELRGELREEFYDMIRSLEERLNNQERNTAQAPEVCPQVSPTARKSSCASAPNIDEHSGNYPRPVCDIKVATRCNLQVRINNGTVPLTAAWGIAYPSTKETMVHGTMIALGFTKVNVDGVYDSFKIVDLPKPPNDEIVKLGDAIGTFIQWPSSDISLVVPSVMQQPQRSDLPTVSDQLTTKSAFVAQAPLDLHNVDFFPAHSSPVKASYNTKKGKAKRKKERQEQIDYPSAELAKQYKLGEPLITKDILNSLSMSCQHLHFWYTQQAGKPEHERTTSIMVRFQYKHLFNDSAGGFFAVDFLDLFHLYNLDALDAALIRCWTL